MANPMNERDYKAMNATENRNNKGFKVAVTFTIAAFILMGIYVCNVNLKDKPNQKTPTPNYDSLINALKAQDKYIGIVEIDLSRANEARVKAENELRDRKPIYITRVERIIANAPDTCLPHLIAMQAECDTLQAKSDSTISALKFEVVKSDTVIKAVKSKLETVTHFNDKLTSENKELASDNKKLERKNKVARFFNKVFVGAAVGFTAVVVYLTSVK